MRGLESQLYNKANELQEDISMKKFDLRAKQIHLSAVKAQVSGPFFCFTIKQEGVVCIKSVDRHFRPNLSRKESFFS